MHIPPSVHIKGLFARDKDAFWFNHFTDEEKELRRMDAWQLAKVIHEADVHKNNSEKRIVAEHLLNVRLAQIQSKASWGAGVLGFVGALIGAVLSVSLANVLQTPNQALHTTDQVTKKQVIAAPVKELKKPVIQLQPQALTHHSSVTPNGAP